MMTMPSNTTYSHTSDPLSAAGPGDDTAVAVGVVTGVGVGVVLAVTEAVGAAVGVVNVLYTRPLWSTPEGGK
jgi:hypothetical protein